MAGALIILRGLRAPEERMKTVDITYAGRTVALPDLADYQKFYRKLAAGSWEPRTFEVLGRNLDRDTVYVDIGAWIGVTPFWACQTAKAVIALEPDPKCCAILDALGPRHDNVMVIHGALSAEAEVTIHAVGGFGSSETSILDIGDGESAVTRGIRLDEIMQRAGPNPVFVKIDIEGYEFITSREIATLRHYPVRGLQLAVHPQLFERSLKGNRMWRRMRTSWSVWKLSRVLRGSFPLPALAKYRSVLSYLVFGILLADEPKGADFVFERRTPSGGKGLS
jgi:FkbM family methyltransferase